LRAAKLKYGEGVEKRRNRKTASPDWGGFWLVGQQRQTVRIPMCSGKRHLIYMKFDKS
jgi:hypothetical protein